MSKLISQSKRFYEIDIWRSVAIISMVIFHVFYGMDFFKLEEYEMSKGLWDVFGNLIRWSFLLLVGIGMQLSYQRYLSKGKKMHDFLLGNLKRGLNVFLCGALISFGSYLVMPSIFVRFGILHLIGTSIILLAPFVRFPKVSALLGLAILLSKTYVHSFTSSIKFLAIFGIYDETFATLDYFPIIPWLAFPALGIFLGSLMFKNYQRTYPFPEAILENTFAKTLIWIGKRSLLIYVIHIPILFFILAHLAGF
jgi:uncharacterized membrane protein